MVSIMHLLIPSSHRSRQVRLALAAGLTVLTLGACSGTGQEPAAVVSEERPNQLVGTWRMVSAVSDPGGNEERPYGNQPNGLANFNANGTFVEVLQNSDVLPFKAEERPDGTQAEKAAAFDGAIGQYGTYEVDENGAYERNTIDGSTWPNRNGYKFTKPELNLIVSGDRLREELRTKQGTLLVIEYERVR